MIKTLLPLAAVVAAALALPALAQEGGRPLSAHLTGGTGMDPDGAGHATFRVNNGQDQVCYDLMVEKIAPAGAAHIHKGAAGESGPPVVPLKPPGADGKIKDCATGPADVIKDILQNPGNYYVNVHNAEFRGGAIRGQLSK
ncbi:CHRD domain-containing protein [Phenylobacterium sp.]|jgi:hypothetical protein|uniref:CHRD domain-containing protein n=1 Tax=Phenylobacterium sp. TaxID=1871053 RepID=UPI002F9247B1